jgi:amidohydrolase
VKNIAEASGATATVTIDPYSPVTGNDPELLQRMMPALQWAAGKNNVREHPVITGAEDFAHFEKQIPGLYLMLGVRNPDVAAGQAPSNHSPLFDSYEPALITGVRAFVGISFEYAARQAD